MARMAQLQLEVHNVYAEMENHLRLVARNEPNPSQLINLRVEQKNGLKVIDKENNQFSIKDCSSAAFRQIYANKSYTNVSLQDCEFSVSFIGMKCSKIQLTSKRAIFKSDKHEKKEIAGVHIRISIVQNEAALKNLSQELNGYLTRLGKNYLCEQSSYTGNERKSLIDFIAIQPKELKRINHRSNAKLQQNITDPLKYMNPEDKKLLEILRTFITRQQINDFALAQDISQEAAAELRKLALVEK